jgi:hypothetical protein
MDAKIVRESSAAFKKLEDASATNEASASFVGLLQAAAADDPNLSSALFESVEVTEFVPPSEEDIASAIEGKTRVKKGVELEGSSNVIKCGVVSLFGVLVGAVLLV